MKRRRLGILLKSGHLGGPGRYVRSLLNGIDRDEFEVIVFGGSDQLCAGCGALRREPLEEEAAQSSRPGGEREGAGQHGAFNPARALAPFAVKYWMGFTREAQRLARTLRREPVDLLHTNETGCEESAVAARIAGVPAVVGTFHVLPDVDVARRRGHWVHRQLERRSVQAMNLGIAVSEAGRAAWLRQTSVLPDRIVTIHNGIDPQEFRRRRAALGARCALGLPIDDSIVIGTAARLEPVKGLEHLIDAAARLRGEGLDVRVVIAGDGSLMEDLRQLAAVTGLGEHVHLPRFQEDVRAVMEALDIFVLPSLSEALPYVVMEAMAMELPVVASEVGGIPEMIRSGETGFLVPPRDPEGLADRLRALVQSSALRRRMGLAGRQRVEECFDEDRMIRRTVEVYRTMLRKRRACA